MKTKMLVDICENAKEILTGDPKGTENRAALEALAEYSRAAKQGNLSPERLSGFLHGLAIVGTFTITSWLSLKDQLMNLG